MNPPLLSIEGLTVAFATRAGTVAAVDGVSLALEPGEVLGLVGESGSGKSVTALAVMGLLPEPIGRIAAGAIRFEGRALTALAAEDLRRLRGDRMAMIFQEPMTSLNPLMTVGTQIAETLVEHRGLAWSAARGRAKELLERVRIADAQARLESYPHELSGGMRQRVMIAAALACEPRLLIADEPTTALDVTIQAQILDLLRELRRDLGMAVLLITHDLGVVAEFADRIAVMYAGRIVEDAPVARLFAAPLHPYTQGLLRSMPEIDRDVARLAAIEGTVPHPGAWPAGCRFAPRCERAGAECRAGDVALRMLADRHAAACLKAAA
ncbi:MAG: ABC transporter ATP-binding protein [Alphaproteobacteria bacterium]|nr:ABC transporter ATP-binding protein [Alphaproteobacteria bacterium]